MIMLMNIDSSRFNRKFSFGSARIIDPFLLNSFRITINFAVIVLCCYEREIVSKKVTYEVMFIGKVTSLASAGGGSESEGENQ